MGKAMRAPACDPSISEQGNGLELLACQPDQLPKVALPEGASRGGVAGFELAQPVGDGTCRSHLIPRGQKGRGAPAIDQRLFYAEGIFDVKGGLDLLATIVTDRELSTAVFADKLRMDRDLLADGAEARLLTMFGRLGAAPSDGPPR